MPKTKKTKLSVPKALITILIISLAVIAVTPFLDQLKPKAKIEERKIEKKWQQVSGVYKTTWGYTTPSGQDKIGFTLTLEGDIIKDVKVEVFTTSRESIDYQKKFGQELPKFVVGKKLGQVAGIDRIAGATGTPKQFKEAVGQLQKDLGF